MEVNACMHICLLVLRLVFVTLKTVIYPPCHLGNGVAHSGLYSPTSVSVIKTICPLDMHTGPSNADNPSLRLPSQVTVVRLYQVDN